MGGAVSTGKDNDELIDNLKDAGYIKTHQVEQVFRIVDRAHYYLPECRDSAYKDLAWKSGTLHLSAPCIYSEVMEALELRKGLSFLNLGSGTGYLNTMVGLMIGPYGINHGIELHLDNVTYANKRLESFIQTSKKFDDLELCEPHFVVGNCLNLAPENRLYDRLYCGAACPPEQKETIQNMLKINGILVIPVGDQLLKIRRIGETEFSSESVLPVSFASLVMPMSAECQNSPILLPDVNPISLQYLCRITIRNSIRNTFDFSQPEVGKNLRRAKQSRSSKFYRSEIGRYPLNILPTAQGLMIMRAFDNSDEDEDFEESNEGTREADADRAFEFRPRLPHRTQETNDPTSKSESKQKVDDVDSDLSEMEDEDAVSKVLHFRDINGNKNVLLSSSGSESKDGKDRNAESHGERSRNNRIGMATVAEHTEDTSAQEKPTGEKCSKVDSLSRCAVSNPYERIADRILTLMSAKKKDEPSKENVSCDQSTSQPAKDGALTSEFSARSPAIEVTPSVCVSVPYTAGESYSTSADTSETSGFGSLGEDPIHISCQHSGHGSLKDETDVVTTEELMPSSSLPPLTGKQRHQSSIGESSADYDSLMADSADTAWVETEDDDDDDDDDESEDEKVKKELCKLQKIRSVMEHKVCGRKGRGIDDDDDDDDTKPTNNGPDFSSFLKTKIETLPIPSSMKAFLLYYRQTEELDSPCI